MAYLAVKKLKGLVFEKRARFLLLGVFVVVGLTLSLDGIAQRRGRGKKKTVYDFEAEDIYGKGKGPNNVFLKVGEIKHKKLIELRKHFRPEMKKSLELVR